MRRLAAVFASLLLAGCAAVANGQAFALHDGDTVVFYGDSITAQRLYTTDVEEFVLTRYPALHARFVNAGVPGDTASGGYAGTMAERVARDVAPYQPAMITVMLGMNDGGWGFAPPDNETVFESHYRALLDALHRAAPGAAFTLLCPTPYDENTHGTEFPGYARIIDSLAADVARIGAQIEASGKMHVMVADLHRPLQDALGRAQTSDPQLAPLLIPDRIHPGPAGQWIMALALLSAWHVNPMVSGVTLNATTAGVAAEDRATVTEIKKSAEGLEWTQLDDALPLPLDLNDAMTSLLLRDSAIGDFDRMVLRAGSLDPGRYLLTIDGKPVATFTDQELEQGVNLALYKTPMLEQSRGIAGLEERRAELDQARFILSDEVTELPSTAISEATLRQAQDEFAAKIRAQLDPKPHRFALRREKAVMDGAGDMHAKPRETN